MEESNQGEHSSYNRKLPLKWRRRDQEILQGPMHAEVNDTFFEEEL